MINQRLGGYKKRVDFSILMDRWSIHSPISVRLWVAAKRTCLSLLLLLMSSCEPVWADEIEDLIPAIVQVESNGDAYAISEDGCMGLMQLSRYVIQEYCQIHNLDMQIQYPIIADGTGRRAPDSKPYIMIGKQEDMFAGKWEAVFIPDLNVKIGEWYLRRLKDHYLKEHYTVERMLAAYNCGPTYLKKVDYDISKCPRETRNYVKKIMKLYRRTK